MSVHLRPAGLACLAGAEAQAQEKFPSRPVTILLGYPPGGSTDTTARDRPGARAHPRPAGGDPEPAGRGRLDRTQAVANAAPDGYTITVATTQLALLPAVERYSGGRRASPAINSPPSRPLRRSIGAVRQPEPALADLPGAHRGRQKRPGQIVYASGGLYGNPSRDRDRAQGHRHKMRHLPTAGGGPALTAVLGNHAALLAAHPRSAARRRAPARCDRSAPWGAKRVASFPTSRP